MKTTATSLLTGLLLCAALPVSTPLLGSDERPLTELYAKSSVMIPMRDDVKLYTEIYTPVDQSDNLPILLLRTPYRVAEAEDRFTRYLATTFRELAKDGYVIAVQDARGRHNSEGQFEWNRPVRHRTDPNAIDASTDAWDTIDWLVGHVPRNNGRVGMLGVSYPGWYVAMALIDPHPALQAASPQASPSDYFVGDDFFHFGAFRLSPGAELPYLFDFDPKQNSRFPYDQVDTYEFFLDLGPLSNMNARYLHHVSPTWNNFMNHATYDEYWEEGGTLQHVNEVAVPTLNVVGWWDAENLGGALDLYDRFESFDTGNRNWLLVGPWAHGQWSGGPADRLVAYEFGSDTLTWYQRNIEARFFAHFLKDEGDLELSEAILFQTGTNQWTTWESWPPASADPVPYYFGRDGSLGQELPSDSDEAGCVTWVSDPAKPVPYTQRPVMGFWSGLAGSRDPRFDRAGKLWKVEDQRFVQDRPDVVSFVTPPLETDLVVAGKIEAQLWASTTGTDSDWVVKLIDVYPEAYPDKPEMGGYQLMIADDVIRGKFRNSLKEPTPLTPGELHDFRINLRTRNHVFRAGHRVMVQVQSSWFPLIDRNPQRFVDIPRAVEADFQAATQRLATSTDHASCIVLPVIRSGNAGVRSASGRNVMIEARKRPPEAFGVAR